MAGFNHLNEDGEARIVDISKKDSTPREATAKASIVLSKKIVKMIKEDKFKKGDVLNVSRIAGISASKKTSSLIPLCHNILIDHCEIKFVLFEDRIEAISTVKSDQKTGVEMEALTAVSISALTIYDMVKGVDKSVLIEKIGLLTKKGGKSGHFKNKNLI